MTRLSSIVVASLVVGCQGPRPTDGEAREVTVGELARRYRDDPKATAIMFTNQLVRVRVDQFDRKGPPAELRWHVLYDDKPRPPVVVLIFAKDHPVPEGTKPAVWVEGVCRGRADDGKDRGRTGYTFSVTVEDCRIVPGPPRAGR